MLRSIVATCVLCAVLTGAAFAHASLKSSSIAEGETLHAPPSELRLEYSAAVGLAALSLETEDGVAVDWAYRAPRQMQAVFVAPMPELEDGDYVLSWRAMASDGHVMTGQISFSLAHADGA